ncbi:acyl-CoA dehydrogenase family protein [Acerihabitans arboris]|uniref:Monooxygenase n=1 Tax=Acerihabitans arboris TaxID=2691583 RepID=A0A845SGC9_9GAMM|nr:acyl-CoA dehydrogenase family protein [Acerihabitans arboris]NDL61681.1 monooxygenase [Acerihabitans arboris]
MTYPHPLAKGTDYARLAARFRPVFSKIAAGAIERERTRTLPLEPIRWLKEAGFGTLRIPEAQGGHGASLPQLFQLLTELAEADPNLPQALRAHMAFVEDRLNAPDSPERERWFRRFIDGDIVGSGWTEIGAVKLGEVKTKVTPSAQGWRLDGEKFYSTGALFADWIDVFAQRSDNGGNVIALVATRQEGVLREDDWDGFGQRTTGSGTTRFQQARVEPEHVYDFADRFRYQTAFYQHVLLATLAGIGRAVQRDVAEGVRRRQRIYSHGNAARASEDAQVQQVVGQIGAWAYAVESTVLRATGSLQLAYEAHFSGDGQQELQANILAEVDSAKAQVIATQWVQRAAGELFNALGASDTRAEKALDRHWRNARTLSSHNPVIYKARIVGDYLVNGHEPMFIWQIGNGPDKPPQA